MTTKQVARALKINSDGKTDIVFFKKPQISVKELQESVSGYFEFIYLVVSKYVNQKYYTETQNKTNEVY